MNYKLVTAAVVAVLGLGAMGGGIAVMQRTRSFLERADSAEGTVVKLVYRKQTVIAHSLPDTSLSDQRRAQQRARNRGAWYPVVSFQVPDGRTIQFTSSSGDDPAKYLTGDKVTVLYDPADPQTARINDFFSLWGMALILGSVGAVFALLGFGLMVAVTSCAERKPRAA